MGAARCCAWHALQALGPLTLDAHVRKSRKRHGMADLHVWSLSQLHPLVEQTLGTYKDLYPKTFNGRRIYRTPGSGSP